MPTDGTDVKVGLRGRRGRGWGTGAGVGCQGSGARLGVRGRGSGAGRTRLQPSVLSGPGLHGGSRLRPRRGQEVPGAGREGGAGQRGQRDPLPRHADVHGEARGPEGLPGLQGEQIPAPPGADFRAGQDPPPPDSTVSVIPSKRCAASTSCELTATPTCATSTASAL